MSNFIYIPGSSSFNEKDAKLRLLSIIQPHFDFDLSDRVSVRADVHQFNYKEDESVWKQVRQKAPVYMEVYWDNVWLCDFTSTELPEATLIKFLTGFGNAYNDGQITLNTDNDLQVENTDTLTESIKKAHKMNTKSEEEKLAQKAVLEVLEEKKTQRDKKRRKIISKLK